MTISVTCGSCKAIFRVKDEYAGRRGKGPHCQGVVEVRAAVTEESKARATQAPARAGAHLVMQEILQSFQGDVQPIRRTATYTAAVLILTVCMVALPALYL